MPIDHVKLPVSDLDASRAFYGPPSAPFGYRLVWDTEPTLGFGIGEGGEDDEPIAFERRSGPIEPVHVAFTAATTEQVDAFTPRRWPLAERTTALPASAPSSASTSSQFRLRPVSVVWLNHAGLNQPSR